jgi:uncharacterized protein
VSTPRYPLRLNVGFIVHESIGYSREFQFEIPSIRLSEDLEVWDLEGAVRVTRTPQGLPLQVKMHASVKTQCGRCLADTLEVLNIDFTEMYAFSPKQAIDSGLILPEDMKIDLVPLLREYFLLEVPISPLCRDDCKGLRPTCGVNLNINDHTHTVEDTDPRLAVLRKLLDEDDEDDEDQGDRA